ncbi:hypothetical protein LCGC14_0952590 [marine sediment metagenome]|uniref:DUF4355 domain-containing protein n=1 Tax=marine sediment metagenome TaxID=412755 RepID=A0A0F9NGV1_9ZZZZ
MTVPGVTAKKGEPNPGGSGPSLQNPPGGAPPAGQPNPADTPTSFTEEQVNQRVQDALAEAGRTELSRQQLETNIEAHNQRVTDQDTRETEWQNQQDARRTEAARDNPEALNLIQEGRILREQRFAHTTEVRQFEAVKATQADRLANADRVEIRQIAIDKGVSPEILLSTSGGNVEQAKKLGDVLPKLSGGNGGGLPGPGGVPSGIKPDSAVTLGGEGSTIRSLIDRAKGVK